MAKKRGPNTPAFAEPYVDEREETVLLGHHPEIASIYCSDFDARDPKLEPNTRRMDYKYASPQERQWRKRYE